MSIEAYRESHEFVSEVLTKEAVISQMTSYEEFATKTLLIAAAGQNEKEILQLLTDMPRIHNSPIFISEFISKQALKRKYHTLFDWNGGRITSFASLFGLEMRENLISACGDAQCTKDFFYIGSERNKIVHKGLATESIDKTFNEVWEIYISSRDFIATLKSVLH